MDKHPTIHVPHGYVAFGKTTLAKKLATQLPAVLIDFDDWVIRIYGKSESVSQSVEWAKKLNPFVYYLIAEITRTGTNVVFDGGFWSKNARKDLANFAKSINTQLVFHEIMIDIDTARTRKKEKNKNNPARFVNEEWFEKTLSEYSPISDDENLQVIKVE